MVNWIDWVAITHNVWYKIGQRFKEIHYQAETRLLKEQKLLLTHQPLLCFIPCWPK